MRHAERARHRSSVLRAGFCAVIFLFAFAPRAKAAPWWWAQFTIGDHSSSPPANKDEQLMKLLARFISAAGNGDTVTIASFTWHTSNNSNIIVAGEDKDTSIQDNGLVAEANAVGRTAPVRVIGDSDQTSFTGNLLNDIAGHPIAVRGYADASGPQEIHNKIIVVPNIGVLTTSANFTGSMLSGFSGAQPNNLLFLKTSQVPDVVRVYEDHMDSFFNGNPKPKARTNWLYYSPQGDTIEIYFAPEDNDSITAHAEFNPTWTPAFSANGGYDIEDVLTWRVEQAKESVLYLINKFTLTAGNGHNNPAGSLRESMVDNNTALVEGATEDENDGTSGNYAALSGDHTCRDASSYYSGSEQMHHKFMIFDLEIVATGSANHTGASMRDDDIGFANMENEILIHDFRLARRFVAEWHRVMQRLSPNAGAGGDAYETTPPAAPKNLTVTPGPTSFTLTWDSPGATPDFSRY